MVLWLKQIRCICLLYNAAFQSQPRHTPKGYHLSLGVDRLHLHLRAMACNPSPKGTSSYTGSSYKGEDVSWLQCHRQQGEAAATLNKNKTAAWKKFTPPLTVIFGLSNSPGRKTGLDLGKKQDSISNGQLGGPSFIVCIHLTKRLYINKYMVLVCPSSQISKSLLLLLMTVRGCALVSYTNFHIHM